LKSFVVYKSSAGSGKTFTLVREYLRLSLHDERRLSYNFRRILAVTFTNKAAAEMKSRVIDALHEISTENNTGAMTTLLCADLQITRAELR
jgi:ATP-dependent exoDNAse (exonuclease V) beta subunit